MYIISFKNVLGLRIEYENHGVRLQNLNLFPAEICFVLDVIHS